MSSQGVIAMMAKYVKFVVLCFWVVQSIAVHAQETEQAELEIRVPGVVQFNYDPFSGLPSSDSINIEIHNLAAEVVDETEDALPDLDDASLREVILSIQPLDAASFNLVGENIQLPIDLVATNQPTILPAELGYEGRIVLDMANTPSSLIELNLKIFESLYADAGSYILGLEISLLDPLTNELIGSPAQTSLEVSVLQKLQTNIAGAKGRYEDGVNFAVIDFEELETGEQQRVFIQVRGNTDADITVSSEHEGRMLNTENPKLYVDYTVDVDGEISDLEVPLKLARSVAKDLQGSAYPMTVIIGDVSKSFSGSYQDIIHVDVSPQ